MKTSNLSIVFLFLLVIFSCNSDDSTQTPITEGNYANGVFVLSEGGYTYNNASLAFIHSNGEIENDIFHAVNGRSLGDVAQSMNFHEDYGYIVVNNSNTVEVVNPTTLESITTIGGDFHNPRYISFYNGNAYVSNWGDGSNPTDDFIAVVDLDSFEVTEKISVPQGPERLIAYENTLYVAQRGDYNYGNTLTKINLNNHTISGSFTVADYPNGLEIHDNHLFVLCSGYQDWSGSDYSSNGALYKINLENSEILDQINFTEGMRPNHLQIENQSLYYTIGKNIYKTSTNHFEHPSTPIRNVENDGVEILYGFNVVNGWLYVCDAKDYQSNGELFVYTITGELQSQYPISGLIPNGVYARQ